MMNKMKMILPLFAAMVLGLNASAQTFSEVQEKYNTAGAAMQGKEFAKAATLFSEVIQEGATVEGAEELVSKSGGYLAICFFQAGRSEAQAEKYDSALKYFTQARDRAEMSGNIQIQRQSTQMIGQLYLAMGADAYNNGRYAEAVESFAKGFSADPTNTDMALNLARSYDKLDSLDKSIEVYKSVIALEERHDRYKEPAAEAKKELALAVLVRASVAAEAKDYDKAIELCNTALEVEPDNAMASLLRLQSYNNKKDWKSVIEYGASTAEAQTDAKLKSDAYYILGAAYQSVDNKDKAIESLRKVTTGTYAAQAKDAITKLQQ